MATLAITRQQVIELVESLPEERLQSLYDFTLFLQRQPLLLTPETDLFGESATEIEADEERWQDAFAASRQRLRAMAQEAKESYLAGHTEPMEFDSDGRIVQ